MRVQSLLVVAAGTALACSPLAAQSTEIGYPQGSLALDAIAQADYAAAERKLRKEFRVSQDDPARLINHGHVLAKTGRLADAARMFEKAAAAEDVELVLADGRVMSSREAARRALMLVSMGGPETQE